MADEAQHLAQASRNQAVLGRLLDGPEPFPDWAAVVAFYKAIHIVEAVFYAQEPPPRRHTTTHRARGERLKAPRYAPLWRHYRPLFEASKVARYLGFERDGSSVEFATFADYAPLAVVQRHLLGVNLARLEANAIPMLSGQYEFVRHGWSSS